MPETTEDDLQRLRDELHALRATVDVNNTIRVQQLRSRITELELEASKTRKEFAAALGADGERGRLLLIYDDAVTRLVDALETARESLSDSNILMTMQLVRHARTKLGLP